MSRGEKIYFAILLSLGAAAEVYAYLMSMLEEWLGDDFNMTFVISFSIAFIVLYFIGFSVVLIILMIRNTGRNRLKAYASKSRILIARTSVPKDIIEKEEEKEESFENDLNKEIEAVMKRRTVSIKMTVVLRIFGFLLFLLVVEGLVFAFGIKVNHRTTILAMIVVLILLGLPTIIWFFCLIVDLKANAYPYFDDDKIKVFKEFDRLDDLLQITEYKIYNKELYLEITSDDKVTYALINTKKMYLITLTNVMIKQRNSLIKEVSDKKEVKREFKSMFNRAKQASFITKNKRLDEVLEDIRTYIYE